MAKVFRLYAIQGNDNIVDWQKSIPYGSTAIGQIKDPDGGDAKKEITSIPSPFARIDLVKTAFKEVVERANKNPNDKEYLPLNAGSLGCDGKYKNGSIYHKLVSETLDVAQIFFDFDKNKNNFEIIVWDREKDLDKYSIFGKTLNRYLESDATKDALGREPYNFGKFKRMYLLNYIGEDRPAKMNIIGATSPSTLFFSSANDLDYVSKNVSFGQDHPFDNSLNALYERDFEFVKYLYTFRDAYAGFNLDFPELDNYLGNANFQTNCYSKLPQQKKDAIDKIDATSISNYEKISVGEKGEDIFEILGRPFHKQPNITNWKSDFEIESKLYKEEKKPLVLPVEAGNTYENLTYTSDKWAKNYRAPYYEETPWKKRTLPEVRNEHPYLTVSDFFMDTIVRMPYKINSESFFDGFLPDNAASYKDEDGNTIQCSYMLPLTDTFFTFFTAKDLRETTIDGSKKMFEFQNNAGGIKAILRIPIKKGKYIEYSRIYGEWEANAATNDGKIIEKRLGLGVMPLVQFPDNVKKHYRIAFFDKGKFDTRLMFYNGNQDVVTKSIVRNPKNIEYMLSSSEAYVVNDNFDRIKILVGDKEGVIIPKYNSPKGKGKFTFAIDFGTTNSHIEYDIDDRKNPKVFDIPLSEKQMHRLHREYDDMEIEMGIAQDFIPDSITESSDYSFPMRTVFSERLNIDYGLNPTALADGNIPFAYEKEDIPTYNHTQTELKWGGIPDKLIKLYLENLFLLLRNKVVMNNGMLDFTKIIWFYPASMTEGRCNDFKRIWKDLYKEYFGTNTDNVVCMSESIAPYHSFINEHGRRSDVVTIDIGGGTTDVYVIEGNEEKMLLSFRFASNAVFGDAYGNKSDTNGFVKLYNDQFREILEKNGLSNLVSVLNTIKSRKISSDIIAFYFSLYNNTKVGKNESLNFLLELSKNSKLKYIFILFYGSIIYFVAKSMKAKGIKKTLEIGFSGNGSKTLNILSDDKEMLGKFAKLIFDGVYDGKYDGRSLKIVFEEQPKKATCKGGIYHSENQDFDKIDNIKSIIIGNKLDEFSDKKLKYSDITSEVEDGIVQSVYDFIEFLFRMNEMNNNFLVNKLSADKNILQIVKDFCQNKEELRQSLIAGLQEKYIELAGGASTNDANMLQKLKQTNEVEDTLFFYPLIGVLHDLALKISEL